MTGRTTVETRLSVWKITHGISDIPGPLYSQDRILQAMGNVTLAFHLLCERANPSSFWLPYIRSLPQEYDTPLFYQQEEVQLLLGTQAVQDFLNQYKNTARQYAYFYKLIQVTNTFCTFSRYKYILVHNTKICTFLTSVFKVQISGQV